MKLSPKYEHALSRSKENKYLIASARRNVALDNVFFHWCEENGYPCIKITEGQKFAEVDINLDTTEFIFDETIKSMIRDLYEKYRRQRVSPRMSIKVCFLEKIPIEDVRNLVKEIMSLLPFYGI